MPSFAAGEANLSILTDQQLSSKKALYLAAKQESNALPLQNLDRWHTRLAKRMQAPAPRLVNIYNIWTRETIAVHPQRPIVEQTIANRFFRCHFTEQTPMLDARLVEMLVAAAKHFKANRVEVISGFRAPKYNLILRKKGRQVARNSQHTLGQAVDFRIPGVPTRRLQAWAKRQRLGGVGVYHRSGFIHIDTGRVRYWRGK